jgi:hypothetical protein
MKRIKRVFGSRSEVCHIWAQQTQDKGRAGNIFFEGTKIYSYGYHFVAAQIHTIKGKRFALVNKHRYSPSTAQHLSCVRDSLNGLMPYFEAIDVSKPKYAVKYNDDLATATVEAALKRMKIENKDSIKYEFECIHDAFKSANQLRKLLGMAERWPTKKQLNEVQAHLEKRLARYHELNTPEMQAKREKERVARQAREAKHLEIKLAEDIQQFRNHGYINSSIRELRYEILHVSGDDVITSRGARVSVQEARVLYNVISTGKDVMGKQIGSFTVIRVTDLGTDKAIKIGCHEILLSEAASLFAETKNAA